MTLEKAIMLGGIIAVAGVALFITIFIQWVGSNLSGLDQTKNLIVALTLAIIGIQTVMGSFMLSILGIKEK